MLWLTWRRHRWLLLIGALLLIGFCVFFLKNGFFIYHIYDQINLAACRTDSVSCSDKMNYNTLNLQLPFEILQGLVVLPLLIGVFVGAPLLPGEQRTASFIRTQGVTLRRWLTIKLGCITLATLFFTVILALVVAWWTPPLFALNIGSQWNYYGSMDGVLISNALFALLLSIAIGALMRRTLPAMVVTFFVMIILMIVFNAVYPYILPPTDHLSPVSVSLNRGEEVIPSNSLIISEGYVDQNGQPMSLDQINEYCGSLSANNSSKYDVALAQCGKNKHLQWKAVYQPATHYWPMQIIETLFLLILSSFLIPIIYWISHKRLN